MGEFDSTIKEWSSYVEHLEQYFAANDIVAANKKQAILLSGCGTPTHKLICNLVAPAKPSDKPYEEPLRRCKTITIQCLLLSCRDSNSTCVFDSLVSSWLHSW